MKKSLLTLTTLNLISATQAMEPVGAIPSLHLPPAPRLDAMVHASSPPSGSPYSVGMSYGSLKEAQERISMFHQERKLAAITISQWWYRLQKTKKNVPRE